MEKNAAFFVSVVAPLHNDADILHDFVRELNEVVYTRYLHYEVILVDDGSTDGTSHYINRLLQEFPCFRYVRLSRSFGQETAISAGLETAIGDVVVVIRPDNDPVGLIPVFVGSVRKSNGVAFGVQANNTSDTASFRLGRRLFHSLATKLFDFPPPPVNSTPFTALSRQALNAVITIKDKARYVRVFSALTGFPKDFIDYEYKNRRQRERHKGLMNAVGSGMDIIVMNTTKPLRYASYAGLFASLMNIVYILYVFVINLFKKEVAEGWTTLSLQNSFMFLLLFLILSILSEYFARLLTEIKDRPSYYIAEERNSNVMVLDPHRLNVVEESE